MFKIYPAQAQCPNGHLWILNTTEHGPIKCPYCEHQIKIPAPIINIESVKTGFEDGDLWWCETCHKMTTNCIRVYGNEIEIVCPECAYEKSVVCPMCGAADYWLVSQSISINEYDKRICMVCGTSYEAMPYVEDDDENWDAY